jgi:hypothetical protein
VLRTLRRVPANVLGGLERVFNPFAGIWYNNLGSAAPGAGQLPPGTILKRQQPLTLKGNTLKLKAPQPLILKGNTLNLPGHP